MDPEDALWMDLPNEDTFGEESDRRDDPEDRPLRWCIDSGGSSEDLGDFEESWYDIGRAERLAEAIYEC